MTYIDLHIHSTHSDGSHCPEAIISLAHQQGLVAISLTDHDTVSGISTCIEAGNQYGITVIPGIELSTSYHNLELHLLGYCFDYTHPDLLSHLEKVAQGRLKRTNEILTKLHACGAPITFEDLDPNITPHKIITRAHFANALLAKGYISYRKQAFEKYLGIGKPAYVSKENLLDIVDAIHLIHQAGGIAILAHPTLYKLSRTRMLNLIEQLVHAGLDGIECYYPSYTPRQTKEFIQICQRHGLIMSGGSDFHGESLPHIALGTGTGNLRIPSELLNNFSINKKNL